jgi:DNA invertase Pin-like site-specific DNA recombinase
MKLFCILRNSIRDMLLYAVIHSAACEVYRGGEDQSTGFLRTSSAANVGEDKDSHQRQMAGITAFARTHGYVILLPPYYDAAVSGSDPIDARPGFRSLLAYMADHADVRTILVESASRFARDLIVQLTGHQLLRSRGIELIPVDAPDHFTAETPTATLIRAVLGAVAEFAKSELVLKLRVARERKRAANGKCEGRKSHAEARPDAVRLARRLYRKHPRTGDRRSLRKISALLAEQGHRNGAGKSFSASAVASMLSAR